MTAIGPSSGMYQRPGANEAQRTGVGQAWRVGTAEAQRTGTGEAQRVGTGDAFPDVARTGAASFGQPYTPRPGETPAELPADGRMPVDAQTQAAMRRMQAATESIASQSVNAQLPPSSLRPMRAAEPGSLQETHDAIRRRDALTPRLGLQPDGATSLRPMRAQ